MNIKNLQIYLPAIWLVFGGSYLNHKNAPNPSPDHREKLLLDLLRYYLQKKCNEDNTFNISEILKLLDTWSSDLDQIYRIRESNVKDTLVSNLAKCFFDRIQTFENCTVIPNGLFSAQHKDNFESVNLAILKKHTNGIDWIQMNPGSTYHQHCKTITGEKSCSYLEIKAVDIKNITQNWLYLLVRLKAISPSQDYKELSLYECLLAQLNGETRFKAEPDEYFVTYTHTSPSHTWQVIEQTFRYLLEHFLGENYHDVYKKLMVGFKLFLLEETFAFYQQEPASLKEQCHYLLQEMCSDIAAFTLSYGDQEQIDFSLNLINAVKTFLKEASYLAYQESCKASQLDEPHINSLCFSPPRLLDYSNNLNNSTVPQLQSDPWFRLPTILDGSQVLDCLKNLKNDFINKLIDSSQMKDIALLSHGIERFFVDYLANTNILEKSNQPFTNDDTELANALIDLAQIYYACQNKMVKSFLSGFTYQPQFYAKNLTIQFFTYAAVAALNYRDANIASLLTDYNLSTEASDSLEFNRLLPHLVIDDERWLKLLFAIKNFFNPVKNKTLFSSQKFDGEFKCKINNTADSTDEEVKFAYALLKKDIKAYERFKQDYRELKYENSNTKWVELAYGENYLPSLYCSLLKMAFAAKVALTGFNFSAFSTYSNQLKASWSYSPDYKSHWDRGSIVYHYWESKLGFYINGSHVKKSFDSQQFTAYVLKPIRYSSYSSIEDPYQRLIITKDRINQSDSHLLENEIIASQQDKPAVMDRIQYLLIGAVQANPLLKLERLYIAIKQRQLDFAFEQDVVLIKQALFELSHLYQTENGNHTLLEWTARSNPQFIHQLGLLCVEKALAMKFRLTQHQVINEVVEVSLALLTFYPADWKADFIAAIEKIYSMLEEALLQPQSHLNKPTLLHLNAYLIISAQVKPMLTENEMVSVLTAFRKIETYKIDGINLDNSILLQVHKASFKLRLCFEEQLEKNLHLLNRLMLSVIPNWNSASEWQSSTNELLFTCGDYAIDPMQGKIYFKNNPFSGLPDKITGHELFKEYFGPISFAVQSSEQELSGEKVPCYLSVDRSPELRLTLIGKVLLIEEWIKDHYELYHSAKKLLNTEHPTLLCQEPSGENKFTHWQVQNEILIKNKNREIIYRWDLQDNTIYSAGHEARIVSFAQLKDAFFKTLIARIESSDWIEITAKSTNEAEAIEMQSLHFPRLGLSFDYKHGQFLSRQIHGYYLSNPQCIPTLLGFSQYLVLEKVEPGTLHKQIKLIIPHRRIYPTGFFYDRTIAADLSTVESSGYFVYDFDQRLGLLKANSISARLYLALLYYCSASLDDADVSGCNAYHLASENLELCWKDQPYDNLELSIIGQLLSNMRDWHKNRIAIYLKVISLLKSSLRLDFLYNDALATENKKISKQLLANCAKQLPGLFAVYLQNQAHIFSRVKLSKEEERDVMEHLFGQIHAYSEQFHAYQLLHFSECASVILSSESRKMYKDGYAQLFDSNSFFASEFVATVLAYRKYLVFSPTSDALDFSKGIDGILSQRFRLENFLQLYQLARSGLPNDKYRYLLHHMVLKANPLKEKLPPGLVQILARALLIVAENPDKFPMPPTWITSDIVFNLNKRSINEDKVKKAFPKVTREKNESDDEACRRNNRENANIFSYLKKYDLDDNGVPLALPNSQAYFSLKYESYCSDNSEKMAVVREFYLKAARNNEMYKFFQKILHLCDQLKLSSSMGWNILPFVNQSISLTFANDKLLEASKHNETDLLNLNIPQEHPLELTSFFVVKNIPPKKMDFPFEAQLKEEARGYDQTFYAELKDSWNKYYAEDQFSYDWLNEDSMNQLEAYLKNKEAETNDLARAIWQKNLEKFNRRIKNLSAPRFALSCHSGAASQYHHGDILTLLINPNNLLKYNPALAGEASNILQDLLHYITHQISTAKIRRVLSLLQQYKSTQRKLEKFSLLQRLVNTLQEKIEPAAYANPHWLLFQLENNLIVRSNQRELILAMLNQNEKAMYQLNMGEGKSSVILPLLSCDLANGTQLLRINVLHSLLMTMQNLLRQRFSGLIKKRIYMLPFYRDTDISIDNLKLIFQALKTCQIERHILLVTPEHRMCLQLKIRELMLENQEQTSADGVFKWQTYRNRKDAKSEVYRDLTDEQVEKLLAEQDQALRKCLIQEQYQYIDSSDHIIKVPPRGQGRQEFAKFRELINDSRFREWSCLTAAYRELLLNSKLAYTDSSEKLVWLNKINEILTIDVLDESDEILRHGTELNYTMGDKTPFSGGELRWQIPQFFIETVLCDQELKNIITEGKPQGFTDINPKYNSHGGVPYVQLLKEAYYEEHIKQFLIEKFCAHYVTTFRKYQVTVDKPLVKGKLSSLKEYISGTLAIEVEKKILDFLSDKIQLKYTLLIAKGWLSSGILFHVFFAKYRVKYGLPFDHAGQMRKPIAVPFLGKDTPSERSEFSHPDVMLGFSILSYLYQGLNQQQLKMTLLKLKEKFCPEVADKYLCDWVECSRDWIAEQTQTFPTWLTSFQNLDLTDEVCLKNVHRYLVGNRHAILFYLNQFVLPQEAQQYLYKISANAHSLVGYNAALGFSGTDDRKITMPFEVKSLRSETQHGTNGKLLYVLTRKRNREYFSLQISDTNDLLKQLCQYITKRDDCHALIDAGALVTGFTNYKVAEFLIRELPIKFHGVIYFSDDTNHLTVLMRNKSKIALHDCHIDKQNLFAYLDDVHTRGTDLQLPLDCHGILTIGMGMQKDKLMQAAMRLRQLAQRQSISLWGTQEVTLAIAENNKIDPKIIDSKEVIKWTANNTIRQINADLFLVLLRKINFQFLKMAEDLLKNAPIMLAMLKDYCREAELFALEDFYALSPQMENLEDRIYCIIAGKIKKLWEDFRSELNEKNLHNDSCFKEIIKQTSKKSFRDKLHTIAGEITRYLQEGYVQSALDNDQEKEVEVEIIQEKEVVVKVENKTPNREKDWDVNLILQKDFLAMALQRNYVMPIKQIKDFIQLPQHLKNIVWHKNIYMTANFINSIQVKQNEPFDQYLRLVDVVLIHRLADETIYVLLSGCEAANIKLQCYDRLDNNNMLVHIHDINGPTMLPVGSRVDKADEKLLTIIKLFSAECSYPSAKETQRLAKRVGRIYPHYFVINRDEITVDKSCSEKLYGLLIENGYLDFSGVMTEKLFNIFVKIKSNEPAIIQLNDEFEKYNQFVLRKLYGIYNKLIVKPKSSLKDNHYILWQWVGTRSRLKDYSGSELESILNPEFKLNLKG